MGMYSKDSKVAYEGDIYTFMVTAATIHSIRVMGSVQVPINR